MRRARSVVSVWPCTVLFVERIVSNINPVVQTKQRSVRVRLPNIGVGNVCDKHRGWAGVNTRRQLSRAPPEPSTVAAPQSRARCCLPCRGPCCVRADTRVNCLSVCLCETLTSPESSRILLAGLLSTTVTTDTSLGLFCNRLKIRYQRFYFTI